MLGGQHGWIKENKGRMKMKRLVSIMEELNYSELILLLCTVLFLFSCLL